MIRKKGFDWHKKQLPDDYRSLQKIVHAATKKLKEIEFKTYHKPKFNNSQVGNYESAIKSAYGSLPTGVPDSNGDVYIPGSFNLNDGIKHLMDHYGMENKSLSAKDHAITFKPMTDEQKQEFKDKLADLVPDGWRLLDGSDTPLDDDWQQDNPDDNNQS